MSQSTRFADAGTVLFSPRMQGTSSSQLNAAGAGGVLLAVLLVGVALGALIGHAAGSTAIGALIGAVFGILGGIFAVYRRYNV